LDLQRCVFTVTRHHDQWAVECDGEFFGHSPDKEIAKAAANRRAREASGEGRLCQVRVIGEHGFLA
jgi:hypothetical protein